VRTPHALGEAEGVKINTQAGRDAMLTFGFEGPEGVYVRRELVIPIERAE
jgi:hypothetical protein